MTINQYKALTEYFRRDEKRVRRLHFLNQALVVICYAAYPLLLFLLLIRGDFTGCARRVLVPGVSFVLVSVFRSWKNSPRPYECGYPSLVPKSTAGHSFPSRHCFSFFMIAMTILSVNLPFGILFLALGCMLAIIRVLEGVHFPKDVIAGALIAIAVGILGYFAGI